VNLFEPHPGAELQKDLEKKGKPWWQQDIVLGDLKLPQEAVAAEQAYRKVHSQAVAVQQVSRPGEVNLTGENRSLSEAEKKDAIQRGDCPEDVETMSITPQYPPNRITPDEFVKNIQHNYEGLLSSSSSGLCRVIRAGPSLGYVANEMAVPPRGSPNCLTRPYPSAYACVPPRLHLTLG
jgi:hypothetical protein